MRSTLRAAARAHLTPPVLAPWGGALDLRTVVWYRTAAQGTLHMVRREAALRAGRVLPRESMRWLDEAEAFCERCVHGGLEGLLQRGSGGGGGGAAAAAGSGGGAAHGERRPGEGKPTTRRDTKPRSVEWRVGRRVLSDASPRIELYPHFLSEAECEHMLRLAYTHAQPEEAATSEAAEEVEEAEGHGDDDETDSPEAAEATDLGERMAAGGGSNRVGRGRAKRRMLVAAPSDDMISRLLEQRCAEATGVPSHGLEAPLAIKHTPEMHSPPPLATGGPVRAVPSLHVDTNNEGTHRCATVIMYLNNVPSGSGETVFPIANTPTTSPLRTAGRTALASGATALFPPSGGDGTAGDGAADGAGGDADVATFTGASKALLAAAENESVGVHVRPRRGSACVFWTMDAAGVDPASWHNGAKVLHGAGGKWIVQKFKELPASARVGGPPRLPAECAPPPLPLEEMLRIARERTIEDS